MVAAFSEHPDYMPIDSESYDEMFLAQVLMDSKKRSHLQMALLGRVPTQTFKMLLENAI